MNKILQEFVNTVKAVDRTVYIFNEDDGAYVFDEDFYYDYDYEENDTNCSNSSLNLSEDQLNIINKIFPPFEIHRQKTRTYKYVNKLRQPEMVDKYLFATLLKSLLIQEFKKDKHGTQYGKGQTVEYLNTLIYACQYIVKYNK